MSPHDPLPVRVPRPAGVFPGRRRRPRGLPRWPSFRRRRRGRQYPAHRGRCGRRGRARALDGCGRPGRCAEAAGDGCIQCPVKVLVRHGAVDEADSLGLGCVEGLPGEQVTLVGSRADACQQRLERGGRHHTPTKLREREARPGPGDRNIARGNQGYAAAECAALHPRDDRAGQAGDPVAQHRAAQCRLKPLFGRGVSHMPEHVYVAARSEMTSFRGKNQQAQLRSAVQRIEREMDFPHRLCGERIKPVGPRESECCDAPCVFFQAYRFPFHARRLPRPPPPVPSGASSGLRSLTVANRRFCVKSWRQAGKLAMVLAPG